MGKIVAIGGGEIGRPRDVKDGGGNYPVETMVIDKEIIRLTGKEHPKLLFIPTASHDSEGYCAVVKTHFEERLGCTVDTLCLVKEKLSQAEIRKKVLSADIVYVGGGDTGYMMREWKKKGVDKVLREAYDNGIVLSGISAGAICWFRYGSSDTKNFKNPQDKRLTRLSCLGLEDITISPHHVREPHRKKGMIEIMKRTPGVGVALDDNSAIEIVDGKYRIISSKDGANAHKVYRAKGKVNYELLEKRKDYASLRELQNNKG